MSSELGSYIRDARKGLGWRVEELAELVQLSPESIRRYEQGVRRPSKASMTKVLAALGAEGSWVAPLAWKDKFSGRTYSLSKDGVARSKTPSEKKEILDRYAEAAQLIYESRSAGDYTWQGLLSSFMHEIES